MLIKMVYMCMGIKDEWYICICCPFITSDQGFCDGSTKAWTHSVSNHVKTLATCEEHHVSDMWVE